MSKKKLFFFLFTDKVDPHTGLLRPQLEGEKQMRKAQIITAVFVVVVSGCRWRDESLLQQQVVSADAATGGSGGTGGETPDASTGGSEPDAATGGHHPGNHEDAAIGGNGGTGGDIAPDASNGGSGGNEPDAALPDAGPAPCQANADCNDGDSCTNDVCNVTTGECMTMMRCDETLYLCREGNGGVDSFVCQCDPDKAFVHPETSVCTELPIGAACPNEGTFACVDFAESNVTGIAKCVDGHWQLLSEFACGLSNQATACNVDGPDNARGCFDRETQSYSGFNSDEH